MTKEELEKEAKDYLRGQTQLNGGGLFHCNIFNLIIGFAEPREKQIQIDAIQIRALQKQNGELTDKVKELEVRCNELFLQTCEQAEKVKELEAQIEKMKCCAKCAHCNTYITSCIPQKRFVRLEDVCEDWEMKENE